MLKFANGVSVKAKLQLHHVPTLFDSIPIDRFKLLTPDEMLIYLHGQQDMISQMRRIISRLEEKVAESQTQTLKLGDQVVELNHALYGKSSEREPPRSPVPPRDDSGNSPGEEPAPRKRVLLPSERYPNIPVVEQVVKFERSPPCTCCGNEMEESGLFEISESLTVTPAKYSVIRQKRHQYRCGKCYGDLQAVPVPPRIKPGSSLSDEMILDVAMTKYCDLIPIQRYVAIAERLGVKGIPPQSLIEATHNLSETVAKTYELLKEEVVAARVLHADETPHRMLEGSDKSTWYLWGFSSLTASYFEAHDTRSGEVASRFLAKSVCEFLMTDVYSGYGRGTREANAIRKAENRAEITGLYCNAHARRRFKVAKRKKFEEAAQFFIDKYQEIYLLEAEAKGKPPDRVLELRKAMLPHFVEMKAQALATIGTFSRKSEMAVALRYFLNHFDPLTRFIRDPECPIDNNPQERLLRNPVIGRKTWYGTHSVRGAETAARLFSIIESCKLNGVNPREYFPALIRAIHTGKPQFTPSTYRKTLQPPVLPA